MENDTSESSAGNSSEVSFDSMNLQIGNRLQLLVVRDVKPVQYFTTLIGHVKDEYLLVKIPFEHGAPVLLHEGEKLTIRVFTGVKVCSFDATVTRMFMQPFFYAHLSFPKAIRATSLRMAMRVKVDIPATLVRRAPGDGNASLPVRLVNVSVTGALIEAAQEIGRNDDVVELSFVLFIQAGGYEIPIHADAKVRNSSIRKTADAPDVHVTGVQFTGLDATNQIALQNLTYEALIGDRQKLV